MSLYQPYQRLCYHYLTETDTVELVAHVIVPVNQSQEVYMANTRRDKYDFFVELRVLGDPNGTAMKDYPVVAPCKLENLASFTYSSGTDLKVKLKEVLANELLGAPGRAFTVKTIVFDHQGNPVGEVTNTITENGDIEIL